MSEQFIQMFVLTSLAGTCILLGGLVGMIENLRPRWLENELGHSVIAFGGGVLVAAVALVLIPEGMEFLPNPYIASLCFIFGAVLFMLLERRLGRSKHEHPQLLAMLLDYLPESIALGGMFASGANGAVLLAVLIGLQNLPEGFNSYRELRVSNRHSTTRILLAMALIIPLGPIMGTLGWIYFSQHPLALGTIMLLASGGIVYLIFQDIAPQSRMERHWASPLGAALGFSIGLLGNQLIGV
jgi:ZIP family zinc transporter